MLFTLNFFTRLTTFAFFLFSFRLHCSSFSFAFFIPFVFAIHCIVGTYILIALIRFLPFNHNIILFNGFRIRFLHCWSKVTVTLAPSLLRTVKAVFVVAAAAAAVALPPLPLFTTNFGSCTKVGVCCFKLFFLHFFIIFLMYYNLLYILYVLNLYVFYVL